MSIPLRVLLLIGAIGMVLYIIRAVRKSRTQMKDVIVWFLIAIILAVFGIFPSVPIWLARMIGIESPANMVFLMFIAILLLRVFSLTLRISMLEDKIVTLSGEIAIRTKKNTISEEDND